tara:strand:- start:4572 stop:4751 length:180 start_codon:yes stop_codon:yes gene_type:complete
MPYDVIDRKTGVVMGTYSTLKGATRKSNSLDNEYGGYRYGVEKIQAKKKSKKSLKIKKA